jgi:hypothetical protein
LPAHRLVAWLVTGGFAVGLLAMFFVAAPFGIPPPIAWAFLVFILSTGALLLNKPRALLNVMMFYFLFMPGNRIFGIVPVPLPGFVDELFFIPFLAVIVMYTIQGKVVRGGLWFPVSAIAIGLLSFYVNGKNSPFTTIRVILINLKFFIIFYFCRLTCTFRNFEDLEKWLKLYVFYGFIQYFYNVWHYRTPFVLHGNDIGTGIFFGQGAHATGYVCIFALFCLAGLWLAKQQTPDFPFWQKAVAFLIGINVFYDLTFMTDTKHGLLLMMPAAAPFLLHPIIQKRTRLAVMSIGVVAVLAIAFYFSLSGTGSQYNLHSVRDVIHSVERRPKGVIAHALLYDMDYRLPFPLLGAGPGRFTSGQAIDAHAPLAMHYIQPFLDESRRASYFHASGVTAAASILGTPQSTLFAWWGEFGLPMTFVFYAFSIWIYSVFWNRTRRDGEWDGKTRGAALGVLGMLGFQMLLTFIGPVYTSYYLSFFLWMLLGRMMDMDCGSATDEGGASRATDGNAFSVPRNSAP